MQAKDQFLRIRDYIDGQNILDELENFMRDEQLKEFCDYLIEEYEVDMSDEDYYGETDEDY